MTAPSQEEGSEQEGPDEVLRDVAAAVLALSVIGWLTVLAVLLLWGATIGTGVTP